MLDLIDLPDWTIHWDEIAQTLLIAGAAVIFAVVLHRIFFSIFRGFARSSETQADELVVKHLRSPVMWVMIEIAISIAANADKHIANGWAIMNPFVIPAVLGWLILGMIRAFAAALDKRTDERIDPIEARGRKTRIALLSRTLSVIVVIITIGFILLGFPVVRDVGTGLLASAGLAALASARLRNQRLNR